MSSAIRRAVEISLGAAALALLVLILVPWKDGGLPAAAERNAALANAAVPTVPAPPALAAPDDVLILFTGRPAARVPQPAAAPAPAQDAPWLLYLGRSQSTEGVLSVFLKDSRSGKLITASEGKSVSGWSIVRAEDGAVTVKNGDSLYSVKTR